VTLIGIVSSAPFGQVSSTILYAVSLAFALYRFAVTESQSSQYHHLSSTKKGNGTQEMYRHALQGVTPLLVARIAVVTMIITRLNMRPAKMAKRLFEHMLRGQSRARSKDSPKNLTKTLRILPHVDNSAPKNPT
jgi:hypothetical protein